MLTKSGAWEAGRAVTGSALWKDPLGCRESGEQGQGLEGWAGDDEASGALGQESSDRGPSP